MALKEASGTQVKSLTCEQIILLHPAVESTSFGFENAYFSNTIRHFLVR